MRITHFEEIEAWKVARQLTNSAYDATDGLLFDRDTALRRQIRTAATSIMANIAEGFDASSHAEFARFLRISRRSATELQSHLYVAIDRRYIEQKQFDRIYKDTNRVKRLLGGFLRYLKNPKPGSPNVERRT